MKNNKKLRLLSNLIIVCLLSFSTSLFAQDDPLVIDQKGNAIFKGKIGLGTSNPSRNLTIEGQTNAYLNIITRNGYEFLIGTDASGGVISTMSNHDLQLRAGKNDTKMIIKSNGNIGVGTPNPGSYKFNVNGSLFAKTATFNDGLRIGSTSLGSSKFKISRSNTDFADFRFSGSGMGQLEFIGWSSGWNINAKTSGKHLYLNRDSPEDNDVYIGRYKNELFIDGKTGRVGIGTDKLTKAKLEIQGNVNYSFGPIPPRGSGFWAGYYQADSPTSILELSSTKQKVALRYWTVSKNENVTFNGSYRASIYASSKILATGFVAYSDARIKNIHGRSNSQNDLETIQKIEVTDYQMKDVIAKGDKPYKKVIAQQVKEVYPQAVSLSTDVIPDIYWPALVENNWVALDTDLKVGEKVQLIFGSEKVIFEVLETSEKGFRVDTDRIGEVFVYGRQVDDFHSVDYEALSMLHVSATQELIRKVEQLEKEKKNLHNDLKTMNDRLLKIEAALQQ